MEQVFKTLVTQSASREHFVFVVPANAELDLKKAAKVSGQKNIEMLPSKQLLPLTGYIHGGCSPVGMKKPFKTFIDETAILYDHICVRIDRDSLSLCRIYRKKRSGRIMPDRFETIVFFAPAHFISCTDCFRETAV